MKDIKENILEEFTYQHEEMKQTPAYKEILENKIKIVNYKIETRVEIQKINLEIKNELDSDSLLDLQKRVVKVKKKLPRLENENLDGDQIL